MVKLVFCLRKLESWTSEDFHAYWRDTHGPLVLRHAETLRIRKYLQLHPTAAASSSKLAQSRNAPEPFDGVAELWFDSADDIDAAGTTTEGRRAARALLEDEARFIDLERSPIWLFEAMEVGPLTARGECNGIDLGAAPLPRDDPAGRG